MRCFIITISTRVLFGHLKAPLAQFRTCSVDPWIDARHRKQVGSCWSVSDRSTCNYCYQIRRVHCRERSLEPVFGVLVIDWLPHREPVENIACHSPFYNQTWLALNSHNIGTIIPNKHQSKVPFF